MKKFLLLNIALFLCFMAQGQSPIGIWENIDDEDGKPKSHIEIYEQDGKLYGKVNKLLPGATLNQCKNCKGSRKNQPLEGMVILWDLENQGDHYDNGTILDPKTGKEYGCKMSMDSADILDVRGYLKLSIFGRTQQWFRVKM